MAKFDDRCPHCKVEIDDLIGSWASSGNESRFTIYCPDCEGEVVIDVFIAAEFQTSKPRAIASTPDVTC